MPKKPNSHGNDQEYVPAGNGDASGEYADEKGSNYHFSNFSSSNNKIGEDVEYIKSENSGDGINKSDVTLVEQNISKMFGKQAIVAFGGVFNSAELKQIENATKQLNKDFQNLKYFIEGVGDAKELNNLLGQKRFKEDEKYTLAYYSPSKRAIVFTNTMKHRTQEAVQQEYDSNFKASNTKAGTYCHEMGHAVWSLFGFECSYSDKSNANEIYNDLQNTIKSLYNKNLKDISKQKIEFYEKYGHRYNNKSVFDREYLRDLMPDKKMYNVSEYGAKDIEEFVAECFSAHYTGMNNELANQCVNAYKTAFKAIGR